MHAGHYMAYNIHQTIMKHQISHEAKFQELNPVAPMIGLAVGKTAVASGPNGTISGPDVLETYFRNDLGFASKWWFQPVNEAFC